MFGQDQYSDEELLQGLVVLFRTLGHPPSPAEVNSSEGSSYTTLQRRFGSWKQALTLARELLSDEEREDIGKWRCPHCGRDDFKNGTGWRGHVEWCKARQPVTGS